MSTTKVRKDRAAPKCILGISVPLELFVYMKEKPNTSKWATHILTQAMNSEKAIIAERDE